MDVNSLSQGRQNAFEVNYTVSGSNVDSGNNTQNVLVQGSVRGNDINLGQNNSQLISVKEKDVKNAVEKLNKLFEGKNTHVEYDFIGKSRTMSVKIIDDKTKDIIKEIPPKKIIEMIDKLCELAGIMVDEKA